MVRYLKATDRILGRAGVSLTSPNKMSVVVV